MTLLAVVMLALGVGSTTAIFSVVDATLIAPLPFSDPNHLARVDLTRLPARDYVPWSAPKFEAFRQGQGVFESLALYRGATATLVSDNEAEVVRVERVTSTYFSVLRLAPAIGRTLRAEHDHPGASSAVIVLGHDLWARRFGRDPAVLGRVLALGSTSGVVIGVLPPGFRGLTGADAWIPAASVGAASLQSGAGAWDVIGRVAPGVSMVDVRAAVAAAGSALGRQFPTPGTAGTWGAVAYTLDEARLAPRTRRAVMLLSGAVGLVLLIACANVANLLLVRAGERERELAVRSALGAGPAVLVREQLVEAALLAAAGGTVGAAVACGAVALLRRHAPMLMEVVGGRLPALTSAGIAAIAVNARVLGFAIAVSAATVLLFGLVPALGSARADIAAHLRLSGRGQTAGGRLGRLRLRDVLVSTEVALALVLLVGAGLLSASLGHLLAVDAGVGTERVGILRVRLDPKGYTDAEAVAFHARLASHLAALPGVVRASLGSCVPISGGCHTVQVGGDRSVGAHWVSPGQFATLGIPLRDGRVFTEDDRQGTRRVVVVSETAARTLWPGQRAIGQRLALDADDGPEAEVVGVVGDVHYVSLEERPEPDVYFSLGQSQVRQLDVFVRTAGDPTAVAGSIRAAVRALDVRVPVARWSTLAEQAGAAVASTRFVATLLAGLAAAALVLAGIGIYAVLSNIVGTQTREIGIRMALGANARVIRLSVLRRALGPACLGIVGGTLGALALARVMTALLFEIAPTDPVVLVAAGGVLAGLALLAAYLPARRATTVSPLAAMRGE